MATVWTVGHGTRSLAGFVALLLAAGIDRLVDVRAVPRSRRHPHFGYGPLGAALAAHRIVYDWRGKPLGGRRHAGDANRHGGLEGSAFRAYAEHMEGAEFAQAVEALVADAAAERLCIACAERDPGQCHRALIADWLVAHGHRVVHLLAPDAAREHAMHAAVRIEAGVLHYAPASTQGSLF
ncbi:MAG: DUF488 domain-containing protein [Proteobacteria bacterium]|nr:DUF488 domain-containing protein [Pseudomonadota bacterium]